MSAPEQIDTEVSTNPTETATPSEQAISFEGNLSNTVSTPEASTKVIEPTRAEAATDIQAIGEAEKNLATAFASLGDEPKTDLPPFKGPETTPSAGPINAAGEVETFGGMVGTKAEFEAKTQDVDYEEHEVVENMPSMSQQEAAEADTTIEQLQGQSREFKDIESKLANNPEAPAINTEEVMASLRDAKTENVLQRLGEAGKAPLGWLQNKVNAEVGPDKKPGFWRKLGRALGWGGLGLVWAFAVLLYGVGVVGMRLGDAAAGLGGGGGQGK